jgi:superfamily II DNA or RNA helicase
MVPFQLFPYQVKGKRMMRESFQKGNQAVVLCIPTGGGKTIVFSDMGKDALKNNVATMVICSYSQLIDQAEEKLNMYGLYPTKIVPGYNNEKSNLYLASVDTLRNWELPDIGFLIIDEAHIKEFDEVALYYKSKGAYIVGATASPIRTGKRFFDKSKMREEFHFLIEKYPDYTGQMIDVYDDMVIPTTITELIENKFLCPAITHSIKVDLSKIKTSKNNTGEVDFNESALLSFAGSAGSPVSYESVVKLYNELAPRTKAICFNINVKHSKRQAEEFIINGIPALHIDGKMTKKEKRNIYKAFKDAEGGIVLCNVGVATTGFDEPSILTVIDNYATLSLSKWLQTNGRGSRRFPGKDFFRIIDIYGNIYRHLWWEFEHEFKLEKEYVSWTKGVAPVKECENCKAIISLSAVSCKFCNMVQMQKASIEEIMKEAGEFMIVDRDSIPAFLKKPVGKMNIEELEKFRELKGHQVAWAVRQIMMRESAKNDLWDYARIKNYSSAWVYKQISVHEDAKGEIKGQIWKFIQNNPHVTEDFIKSEALKKLKSNHSQKEIDELVPKIIQGFKDFHSGKIPVNN